MKKSYFLLTAFLLLEVNARACINCNKQLRQGIYDNNFLTILTTLLTILGLIIITILFLNKRLKSYYNKHGQGFLNPAPLTTAAVVLGVGMGSFIDGIVFHQILQWHGMLSNRLSPTTLLNKSINMFWDGIFHLNCLSTVFIGMVMLWKLIGQKGIDTSKSLLIGGLLLGWGLFNILEGIIDHQIVKLHNVKESDIHHDIGNMGFMLFSILITSIGLGYIRKVLNKY